MKFLLDTDHISILQKQSGSEYFALLARISRVPRANLAFCIVSFHEQVLVCNSDIARAKTSTDAIHGYRMFDRVLSSLNAALVAIEQFRSGIPARASSRIAGRPLIRYDPRRKLGALGPCSRSDSLPVSSREDLRDVVGDLNRRADLSR
jgi:hypothetical protein